jgi:hypothetical protein
MPQSQTPYCRYASHSLVLSMRQSQTPYCRYASHSLVLSIRQSQSSIVDTSVRRVTPGNNWRHLETLLVSAGPCLCPATSTCFTKYWTNNYTTKSNKHWHETTKHWHGCYRNKSTKYWYSYGMAETNKSTTYEVTTVTRISPLNIDMNMPTKHWHE